MAGCKKLRVEVLYGEVRTGGNMGKVSKIMSNSFYFFIDWIIMTLGGYLFWVVIGRLTTPSDVGMFSTIMNLAILIVGFTSLGMNSVLPKLVPEYQVKKSEEKVRGAIRWALKTTTAANLLAAVALIAAAPAISATGYLSETSVVLVAIFMIAINTFYLLGSCLYGLQNIRRIAVTDTLFTFLKLAVVPILVFAGYGYLGLVYGTIAAMFAAAFFRFIHLPKGKGVADTKEIWFYAVPATISTFGIVFTNQGSVVALSFFKPMAEVGMFTIAFLFASILRMVPQIMSMAIFPIASQQWAGKEKSGLKELVTQTTRYSLLLTLPIISMFAFFPRDILVRLLNEGYSGASAILPVLSIGCLLIGVSSIFTNVLYSIGEVNRNRNVILIGGFSNIILSLLAIPVFGMLGASAAFLISGVAMFALSMAWLRKHVKFDLAFRGTAKMLLASAIFSAFVAWLKTLNGSSAWFMVSLATGIVAYAATLLVLRFFGKTDLRVLGEMKGKAPRRLGAFFELARNLIVRFSN